MKTKTKENRYLEERERKREEERGRDDGVKECLKARRRRRTGRVRRIKTAKVNLSILLG